MLILLVSGSCKMLRWRVKESTFICHKKLWLNLANFTNLLHWYRIVSEYVGINHRRCCRMELGINIISLLMNSLIIHSSCLSSTVWFDRWEGTPIRQTGIRKETNSTNGICPAARCSYQRKLQCNMRSIDRGDLEEAHQICDLLYGTVIECDFEF
jgi:hypothetical protein